MKKTLMIVGAIILAGLVAVGSFWGGMAYQTNQASQARANFMNARGQANGEQFPAGGQFPNDGQGPGFMGGGGTTGVVKTVEGNVMTVSTAQDVTTVNLSESSQLEKYAPAAVSDLQPGVRVLVTGQRDDDGNITASQVRILDNNPSNSADLSPAGREP